MLLLSPPKELKESGKSERGNNKSYLDVDFLKEKGLENALEMQIASMYVDRLAQNFLDNQFLASIFDMIGTGLNENLLAEVDSVLPDYKKSSGIVAIKDDMTISLCRDSGSDIQCITTPLTQNSTIYQTQGSLEFKNRVNQGNNTIITKSDKGTCTISTCDKGTNCNMDEEEIMNGDEITDDEQVMREIFPWLV
jgi:hypothetical protein